MTRHGETDHNVARRIQGPLIDDPINARGRAQAKALEARFADERARGLRLAAVYSSPLKRAWETAEAVARGAGAPPPVVAPWLIEFSWGKYLGQTETGETLVAMKRMHESWKAGQVDVPVEGGGESPASAWERARAGLMPVFERHRGATFATSAHGRINKIILAALVARDLSKMDQFGQGNTSVTILDHDDHGPWDQGWRAVLVNDKSHLAAIGEGTQSAEGGGPLV